MSMVRPSKLADQGHSSLLGKPVAYALEPFIRLFPEISRLTFAVYRPAPGLDSRLARDSDPSVEIRDIAERLRKECGIPFWDAILAISMKRGDIPERYVEMAILHDKSPGEYQIELQRSEITSERIQSLINELEDGFVLALASRVVLQDGGQVHIPMMDFRCQPSPQNSGIVKRAVKAMGQDSGLLVNSGRSYHFYGLSLLPHQAWLRFLALAILFTPIVDARYIAHRLADGACRLRVGTGPHKPSAPTVMEIFG